MASDYISRDEVLRHLEESAEGLHGSPPLADLCRQIHGTLSTLPAANVRENVRGEWVVRPASGRFPTYECSACHGYTGGKEIVATWRFCPNCGADMREGGER